MKKFEGVLFCTDLDGTLLNDDKQISDENRAAIRYFQSEGGLFTFVTGRGPQTAGALFEAVSPNAPYGCVNGAGIYDPWKKEYLWHKALRAEYRDLVRDADRAIPGLGIQLNARKELFNCRENPALAHLCAVTHNPGIARRLEEVDEPILKVVFTDFDPAHIEALEAFFKSHPKGALFDYIHSESALYEILPKGVSKGNLLLKMARLFGIDPKKTVAAGDYYNDVSMIRSAALGFAVKNAVDEAKSAARFVTAGNNESAIAAIVEGLDRGVYSF